MAMRTATPWWLSWAHLFALLALLVAQRFLDPWDSLQSVTTLVSVVAVLGVLGIRVVATLRSRGGRRRVERTLLVATIGTLVAIAFFALSTKWGMKLVGLDDLKETGAHHWRTAMRVLAAVFAVASVLPIVMIEAVLGTARREGFELKGEGDDAVEYRRVREVGLAGLTVALAAGLLMSTCSVAKEKDVRKDYSYFRTSAAGESTRKILQNTSEPIKVLLWFPEVNEVKDEVKHYFKALGDATGKVQIEEHDLIAEPGLAGKNKVTKEGTIVLVRGEGEAAKAEKIEMDTDYEKARRPTKSAAASRPGLRNLDSAVNAALMKLVREKRKAYLTVGHGEINDPDSLDADLRERFPDARTQAFKAAIQNQNYEVKNLGLMNGLDSKVPDDATMVLVLGPRLPFSDEEIASLDAYVKGGGHLLVALDPDGDADLGVLSTTLGVRFDRTAVLDDKEFLPSRGPRAPVTNQFSSHASITSMSKIASDAGLPLLGTGSLEDIGPAGGEGEIKRTYVIRSMQSSFRDLDDSGTFTEGSEKRDRYNIVAAIEGPKQTADDGAEKDGFRAMVFADKEVFVDRAVQQGGQVFVTPLGGPMVADAIRWVGGEEVFSGEISNEDDVAIEPTLKQQARWFLLMIVGGPLVVLGVGLGLTMRRRKPAALPKKEKAS